MDQRPIIETFNTHSMAPEVVHALATGRDREVTRIMTAIGRALSNPDVCPQHQVVYGERGSGKSFLLRLVQMQVERLAADEGAPVVMALLPEEQHNIDSGARLLEALAANLNGEGFSYAFDARSPQTAWDEAQHGLSQALDRRFGAGRGLLIAAVENFDTLAQRLFGSGRDDKKRKTQGAVRQQAAEERLRALMNRPDSRLMLLATATRTVDMDYERPLFQAFSNIDLNAWTPDLCIEYFNRRRKLDQSEALNPAESARARAIAEFIGGNPRLAQLLGEVLATPDARTIAATLDALADKLADYYRDRIGDLPGLSRGLIDALIKGGEPCTQTELAERINQRQNQIADAFGYLREGRLLVGERERGGRGQLYQVRDRLFVHFYRRRYGNGARAGDLARIAELLETFYTADEKAEQAIRHLDVGEMDEARLYLDLRHKELGDEGYCGYRDQDDPKEPSVPFALSGVTGPELDTLRTELHEHPEDAYRRWAEVAAQPGGAPLTRAAAAALHALAAARCGNDQRAGDILREALSVADSEGDADARILLLDQLSGYTDKRQRDRKMATAFATRAGELSETATNELVRAVALFQRAWSSWMQGRFVDSLAAAEAAAQAALVAGSVRAHASASRTKGFALWSLARLCEALTVFAQTIALAEQAGDTRQQAKALGLKGWILGLLGRDEEALVILDQAISVAEQAGDTGEQAEALSLKGLSLDQLDRHEDALVILDQAITIAEQAGNTREQVIALCYKGFSLGQVDRHEEAFAVLDQAITLADQHQDQVTALYAYRTYFQIAAKTTTDDLLERLKAALALPLSDEKDWLGIYLDDIATAATLSDNWPGLAELLHKHTERIRNTESWGLFRGVGPVWATRANNDGRASAYAAIVQALPSILEVMDLVPNHPLSSNDGDSRAKHLSNLFNGLVSACDDPGLLRDVADLIAEVIGPETANETQRLRRFADYHAATDKASFLQRCDPDLATAIRRIWEPGSASVSPARKGYKNQRPTKQQSFSDN